MSITLNDIKRAEELMRQHDAGEVRLSDRNREAVSELLQEWQWSLDSVEAPGYTVADYTGREFNYINARQCVNYFPNDPTWKASLEPVIAEGERAGFYQRFDADEQRRTDEHHRRAIEHLNETRAAQ